MTSIHCLSTANQFDDVDYDDQQTLSNLTNDSKSILDSYTITNQKSRLLSKTSPDMNSEQNLISTFSPFSIKNKIPEENAINSPNLPENKQISIEESCLADSKQLNDNKSTEEDQEKQDEEEEQIKIEDKEEEIEEEEEEDDFPAPRQKSNTFTAGYISTHVPCEQKKSRFGMRLNLSIKTPYTVEDSEIVDPDEDSSKEYDSNDDCLTLNSCNVKSDFAKKRSAFFKTFKPESLRLIAPFKNEKKDQIPSILKKENFDEKFNVLEKLGEGCHSLVRRCLKKQEIDSPLQSYAVKIIAYKDPEYLFEILQEERVLSLLNHKNIIKHDSFFLEKDKKKAYIVSEYATGKTLGAYFQNKRNFQMREICSIAKQTLKAIAHMHSKGIIHRDLSYNNIMYDPFTDQVKVIDFTVSKIVTIQKLLTNTGTLNFKAPEMLSGKFYSHSIDIFALGVNIFALIFGYLPFMDSNDKTTIGNIINMNPLEFYKNKENHDPMLLHFLEGLLEKNPLNRMTALQALKHPWINQKMTSAELKAKKYRNKSQKIGISSSTVAELDDTDNEQKTLSSQNQFMVKTLVNLQDD